MALRPANTAAGTRSPGRETLVGEIRPVVGVIGANVYFICTHGRQPVNLRQMKMP